MVDPAVPEAVRLAWPELAAASSAADGTAAVLQKAADALEKAQAVFAAADRQHRETVAVLAEKHSAFVHLTHQLLGVPVGN
jgi:hypothetical protein